MNKKEVCLLLLTVGSVGILIGFSIWNWDTMLQLFRQMVIGVAIVKETVLSLGPMGAVTISLIIIACFFFPVISSLPVQLASVISYGLPLGIAHVLLSVFLASQLAFLFTRSIRVFQKERQRSRQQALEAKIRTSKRSIVTFLLLAYLAPGIPFLLIHTVAANSGMKWWKYALVTSLGPIPDVVVTLWLGSKITTASSPAVSVSLLILIIVSAAIVIGKKEKIIDWIFTPKKEEVTTDGK